MRIVTRPDFDGVVCAALLFEAEQITRPTLWVEPNEMQKGLVAVNGDDILANLPYHPDCGLWFDHHFTNKPQKPFKGAYQIAPSAAGIIYEYYRDRLKRNYDELIRETDKIDSADLTMDEVLHPENYPYVLLSMTISGRDQSEATYWNHLVELVRDRDIRTIHEDAQVKQRCERVIKQNEEYGKLLQEKTRLHRHVTVTDFRDFEKAPRGNRFLVYSLFEEAVVSITIRNDHRNKDKAIIGVGHSIFNRNCHVNVGLLLSMYEGGGHRGAGSCTVDRDQADACLQVILDALLENKNNEPDGGPAST